MKFKTLVFSTALLLFFLSCSQVFGVYLKKWLSTCQFDKVTDEKYCITNIWVTSDNITYAIGFIIKGPKNDYAFRFADKSKSNNCLNSNVVRIDKNDAIYFKDRIIYGYKAHKLLEQMLAGKTAIARCGDVDFTFTLNGFPEGYEFVKENMAFDPLKKQF